MKIQTLAIQGMSCGHCVMSVRKALENLAAVKEVKIGSAVVEYDETKVTPEELAKAVQDAGYAVVPGP